MSRPVFTYLGQTTYDTLGFLLRSLQWPSMSSFLQRGAETKKAPLETSDDLASRGLLKSILDPLAPLPPIPAKQAKALAPGMVGLVNPLLFPETTVERWWASSAQSRLAREMSMLRESSTSPSLVRRLSFLGRPEEGTARQGEVPNRDKAIVTLTAGIVGVVGALSELTVPEQAAPREEHVEAAPVSPSIGLNAEFRSSPVEEAPVEDKISETTRTNPEEIDATASVEEKSNTAVDEEPKSTEGAREASSDSGSGGGNDGDEAAAAVEHAVNGDKQAESASASCKKDPARCTHSTKHVSLSKCASALKKKSFGLDGAGDWLLCLQCGRPWSDASSAEVHASRSNHPVMLRCRDGSLICFKCDNADVSKSVAAQMEPVLSDTDKIWSMVRAKLGSGLNEPKPSKPIKLEGKTIETKEDEPSSISPEAQPIGLKNLGNTCFFNSSLQVLAQSQRVQNALKTSGGLALASALGKCLREIVGAAPPSASVVVAERKTKKGSISSSRGGPVISPAALFSAVCKVAPHFSGFEQQDAQELMTFLLGGIEDEAKSKAGNSAGSFEQKSSQPLPAKPVSGISWKMKHAEFWFGEKAKDVIHRTPAVEDDDSGYGEANMSAEADEDADESVSDADDASGGIACNVVENRDKDSPAEEKVLESPPIRNLTKDVFQVDLESVVRCHDCDSETIRKESQYMLSLALGETTTGASANATAAKGVKGGRASSKGAAYASAASSGPPETLKSCLDRFFAPERLLVSDNNGFQCDRCARRKGQKTENAQAHDATRRLRLVEVRDVLMLHFKRFHQTEGRKGGMRAVKIDTHVRLEQVIELPDGQGEMELVGLVEHLGSSLHGGHYVAYVRSSPDVKGASWFRCSDDSVGKVSESHVFDSAQAYLALYERR